MKRGFIIGIFSIGFFFVLDHGLTKAADVELFLGTSSGFKIVRGTSVSAGTSTFFVGSSTVSIGTTTQAAMLTIAGSSTSATEISLSVKNSSGADSLYVRNDGAILIGTNTSNLNSALYVGSVTSGGLGTITAGFLSVGTISANASLHSGTTTVRFLGEIYAGTITAASGSKFVGDGSGLSGVTSSSLSDTAFSGYTGNITTSGTLNAGSTTVSTFTTTGSITASNGGFVVDTSGSMTASSIKSTGSVTASFLALTGSITAANGSFTVSSTGSMTVSRLAVGTTDFSLGKVTVVGNTSEVQLKVRASSSQTSTDMFSLQTSGGTDIFIMDAQGKVTLKPTTDTGPMLIDGGNNDTGPGLLDLKSFNKSISTSGRGVLTVRSTPSSTITGDIKLVQLVSSTTLTTGSITALNIDNITAGAGTETAISIGSDWDTDLSFVDTSPIIKIGNGGALSFTDGANTLLYLSDNGSAGFLGIGTTTPQSNLHVLGTTTSAFLSVGTITADLSLHGTTTVHFPGGINVTGPKNFLIPHPDPKKKAMGWVLRHSCIESPTRGDTHYRYKVEIESDGGEAFIDLPSYWLYLNENPEVWVSPVGQFAQGYGYVDEVLNKLVVKGEKKGFYNVLLIGTRKDQYAKAFDAKGVEYIDPEINELLTRGEKKGARETQLIDTHEDNVTKNFLDPIVDEFVLVTHQ